METKNKYESTLQAMALSCDAFTTAYLVMCVLFFVRYAFTYGGYAVMWFLPVVCLLPIVVMPIAYMLIHRFDTLLFGRYHFAMPMSAFCAALFFVICWGADGRGADAACRVFFCSAIFVEFVLTYRYCAFSVRARLSGSGVTACPPQYTAFAVLGAFAAICAFFGFTEYDPETAHVNTAYIAAGACVLLALIQYLSTYRGVPRLGGKRVQSVKDVFRAFYSGLDKRMYFSSFLFESAFVTIAVLITSLCVYIGLDKNGLFAVQSALVASFALTAIVAARVIKHRSISLSVVQLACVLISVGALISVVCLKPSGLPLLFASIVAVIPVGIGGAVALRQAKMRFLTVKPLITGGTVYLLSELTMFAAAAVGLLAAATVTTAYHFTSDAVSFIPGLALAAALCVAAFCIAGKRSQKAAPAPEQSYELKPTPPEEPTFTDDRSADRTEKAETE